MAIEEETCGIIAVISGNGGAIGVLPATKIDNRGVTSARVDQSSAFEQRSARLRRGRLEIKCRHRFCFIINVIVSRGKRTCVGEKRECVGE